MMARSNAGVGTDAFGQETAAIEGKPGCKFTTLGTAREILGSALAGPWEIRTMVSQDVVARINQLTTIPVSEERLEVARRKGQRVRLYPGEVCKRNVCVARGSRKTELPIDRRSIEFLSCQMSYNKWRPRTYDTWIIADGEVLPESCNEIGLEQTRYLIDRAYEIYDGLGMPGDIAMAIIEAEERMKLIADSLLTTGDRDRATERLHQLRLNNLCRERVTEAIWRTMVDSVTQGDSISNRHTATCTMSSDRAEGRRIVDVGYSQRHGVIVSHSDPWEINPIVGVRFAECIRVPIMPVGGSDTM